MPIPKAAQMNAIKALKDREKYKDKPMTRSGVITAKQLTTGFYSKDRESKIYSFLSRTKAAQNKNFTDRRQVAYNGWGGDSLLKYLKKKRSK